MYRLLRNIGLFDPFSIEYLIDNSNKKIATIIVEFTKFAFKILNISL